MTLGPMAVLRSRAAPGLRVVLTWTKLRKGMRLRPLGPVHRG
jgi:hypothetical protein